METQIMTLEEEKTADYPTISTDEIIKAKDSPPPRTRDYWASQGVILGA